MRLGLLLCAGGDRFCNLPAVRTHKIAPSHGGEIRQEKTTTTTPVLSVSFESNRFSSTLHTRATTIVRACRADATRTRELDCLESRAEAKKKSSTLLLQNDLKMTIRQLSQRNPSEGGGVGGNVGTGGRPATRHAHTRRDKARREEREGERREGREWCMSVRGGVQSSLLLVE